MKTVALADVLWTAANEQLSDGDGSWGGHLDFTCCAIGAALGMDYITEWQSVKQHRAVRFLAELGCPTGSLNAFNEFSLGEIRQGVRYMWLLLAMHVAEDEGIMLEVPS